MCFTARICSKFYKGEIKGEVLVEGKNINEYGGELSQKIGFVFQNPFTQISGVKDTVFEEVAYGLENFGVPVERNRAPGNRGYEDDEH